MNRKLSLLSCAVRMYHILTRRYAEKGIGMKKPVFAPLKKREFFQDSQDFFLYVRLFADNRVLRERGVVWDEIEPYLDESDHGKVEELFIVYLSEDQAGRRLLSPRSRVFSEDHLRDFSAKRLTTARKKRLLKELLVEEVEPNEILDLVDYFSDPEGQTDSTLWELSQGDESYWTGSPLDED